MALASASGKTKLRSGFWSLRCFKHRGNGRNSQLGLFVATFGGSFGFGQTIFQRLNIGQHQLHFDDFHVGNGIHFASHMDHIGIGKAAHDLKNRIHLANVAEKFIAQPLALAGTFDDPAISTNLSAAGIMTFGLI